MTRHWHERSSLILEVSKKGLSRRYTVFYFLILTFDFLFLKGLPRRSVHIALAAPRNDRWNLSSLREIIWLRHNRKDNDRMWNFEVR